MQNWCCSMFPPYSEWRLEYSIYQRSLHKICHPRCSQHWVLISISPSGQPESPMRASTWSFSCPIRTCRASHWPFYQINCHLSLRPLPLEQLSRASPGVEHGHLSSQPISLNNSTKYPRFKSLGKALGYCRQDQTFRYQYVLPSSKTLKSYRVMYFNVNASGNCKLLLEREAPQANIQTKFLRVTATLHKPHGHIIDDVARSCTWNRNLDLRRLRGDQWCQTTSLSFWQVRSMNTACKTETSSGDVNLLLLRLAVLVRVTSIYSMMG